MDDDLPAPPGRRARDLPTSTQDLILWRLGKLEESSERNNNQVADLIRKWEQLPVLYLPRAEVESQHKYRLNAWVVIATMTNVLLTAGNLIAGKIH